MSDISLKRQLAEATRRVVNGRGPDVEGFGLICAALGELLGQWTGQEVRILICAEGQSEAVDMTKKPGNAAKEH